MQLRRVLVLFVLGAGSPPQGEDRTDRHPDAKAERDRHGKTVEDSGPANGASERDSTVRSSRPVNRAADIPAKAAA
jgi:hypothetical protein